MSIELTIPALGESISKATLVKWLKQVGDSVATDEPVAELETDKVTVTLPAPQAGVLSKQNYSVGAEVQIGASIGTLSTEIKSQTPPKPASSEAVMPKTSTQPVTPLPEMKVGTQASTASQAPATPPLSPSKRQALRDQGAITANPADAQQKAPSTASVTSSTQTLQMTQPQGELASSLREEIVPMSPLRKRIAERLVEAQHTAAILTTFNEVDITAVMALRAKYQEEFTKKHGIKLGFMSFFVKASVEALKAFPGLNAELRGTEIVYKKYYDFGIAVGSGKGLVVPVVRNVDQLSLAHIEKAIAEVALRAKDNKLTLADLTGGTFSITNGGIYGSMMSTPLLNLPQTAILGMHNIIRRPMAVGEQVEIRPMMYLALSYDHRVVDGREAVQGLVQIKEHIEHPDKLLLGI